MIKQKVFNFSFSGKDNTANFYINSTNQIVYDALFKTKNINNIFLYGPKKSGKSYLGNIWAEKNEAIIFKKNFYNIINSKLNVFIDNIENYNNEEELFHILNHCKLYNLKVLITSFQNIDEIHFSLIDLKSRLKIFNFFKIEKPDDDMLLNILTKLFTEKQFVINSNEIFDFILKRADRSYEEMFNIVQKLDTLSLEKKRQLTIPLIKEIL